MTRRWQGLVNVVLVLGGVAIGLAAVEWLARGSPLGEQFAWSLNPGIDQRVEAADVAGADSVRVVGFGDSFAEFRERDGGNFYRIAEQRARAAGFRVRLVNLAEAGTGVPRYFRNLLVYQKQLAPHLAIFAIFLGNDLLDYELRERGAHPGGTGDVSPSPSTGAERLRAYVRRHSIVLNAMFRVMKRYVPVFRSGTFDKNVQVLSDMHGMNSELTAARLDAIDPTIITLARADAINPWDLAFGIVRPRLYAEMLALDERSLFPQALGRMLADFDEIITYCSVHAIRPVFLLIPPSIQIDARYHPHYRRLGYEVPKGVVGPSRLDHALVAYLTARSVDVLDVGPPLRAERGPLYLSSDMHFNATGQMVAGDALFEFLRARKLLTRGVHEVAMNPPRSAVADRRVLEWRS